MWNCKLPSFRMNIAAGFLIVRFIHNNYVFKMLSRWEANFSSVRFEAMTLSIIYTIINHIQIIMRPKCLAIERKSLIDYFTSQEKVHTLTICCLVVTFFLKWVNYISYVDIFPVQLMIWIKDFSCRNQKWLIRIFYLH